MGLSELGSRTRKLNNLVNFWCNRLHIDPQWKISARFADIGNSCGRISFCSEEWTADIVVSESLPDEEIESTVLHEVMELAMWEFSEIFSNVIRHHVDDSRTQEVLRSMMNAARNRYIERIAPVLLESRAEPKP